MKKAMCLHYKLKEFWVESFNFSINTQISDRAQFNGFIKQQKVSLIGALLFYKIIKLPSYENFMAISKNKLNKITNIKMTYKYPKI